MALPSSPPHFAEQFLLPSDQNIPSSPPPLPLPLSLSRATSRKRQFSDYGSQSSDPVFSDATTDSEQHPAVRDPGRKKRFVVGQWYKLPYRAQPSQQSSLKRQNPLRNTDSGVWMGSDDDLGSSEFSSGLPTHGPSTTKIAIARSGVNSSIDTAGPELLAAKVIKQCVDDGKESVNLSSMGLRTLPAATLLPLHQLIRSSHGDTTQVPSEDEFVPLIPSIQLYLYSNQLNQIPSEVFNLANITVLSLRNNELQSIPSAIGRLPRLKELNIAGNRIQYLPFEIVGLLSPSAHRQITLRPNPLLSILDFNQHSSASHDTGQTLCASLPSAPVDPHVLHQTLRAKVAEQATLDHCAELEIRRLVGSTCMQQEALMSHAPRSEYELIYLASSALRYFTVNGALSISARTLKNAHTADWSAQLDQRTPLRAASSAAPSLFELALRSLQCGDVHDALDEMAGPDNPESVLAPIRRAAENKDNRYNSTCSTCQRDYIIPRAEWIEYWSWGTGSQLTNGSVFPFLRRACSWSCARPSEVGDFRV